MESSISEVVPEGILEEKSIVERTGEVMLWERNCHLRGEWAAWCTLLERGCL